MLNQLAREIDHIVNLIGATPVHRQYRINQLKAQLRKLEARIAYSSHRDYREER